MSRNRKNTPPVKRNQHLAHQQQPSGVTIQEQQYSGPVPPPEILNGFEQIVPGAAERILAMAEENGRHQREMEKKAIELASRTVLLGQIFGFAIGILALITCIIALYLESENTAMTIGGVTITGLVTVFVTGRFRKSKNSNSMVNT